MATARVEALVETVATLKAKVDLTGKALEVAQAARAQAEQQLLTARGEVGRLEAKIEATRGVAGLAAEPKLAEAAEDLRSRAAP